MLSEIIALLRMHEKFSRNSFSMTCYKYLLKSHKFARIYLWLLLSLYNLWLCNMSQGHINPKNNFKNKFTKI